MKLEVVRALNPEPDKRICRTIKAQYQKNGIANFVRGGVMEQRQLSEKQGTRRIKAVG